MKLPQLKFEEMRDFAIRSGQLVEGVKIPEPSVHPHTVPMRLLQLRKGRKRKMRVTITAAISDLHIGHEDFLPCTLFSTIDNLVKVIRQIKKYCSIVQFNFVLVGDIVSGARVYKDQYIDNIINKEHFQVSAAVQVIRGILNRLDSIRKVDEVIHLKGTHEKEGNNYTLLIAKLLGPRHFYHGRYHILNIAEPLGTYNVCFFHGFGRSDYYAATLAEIREMQRFYMQKLTYHKIRIHEFCKGHSHWLWLGGVDPANCFYWSVLGGFQRWKKTMSQRRPGMILYVYLSGNPGTLWRIPIEPDPDVYLAEIENRKLEFSNHGFYESILSGYFAEEATKEENYLRSLREFQKRYLL